MAVHASKFGLNCQKCTKLEKEARGCTEKSKQPYILEINGKREELERCPIKLIHQSSSEYIRLYNFYKEGFLPFPGTIMQQPAKLMAIFEIIEREVNEVRRKEHGSR